MNSDPSATPPSHSGSSTPRRGAAGTVEQLRQAPLGIALIAAMLAMIGAGLLAGGLYLVTSTNGILPWAAAICLVGGPLVAGFALAVARMAEWAWVALMALLTLLAASSVIRILVSPGLPIPAAAELLVEIVVAAYLWQPRIRACFGRT